MRKTGKKIKPRPKVRAPMLVMRTINQNALELRERMAVRAFEKRVALKMHYDTLLDMQGVLMLAGTSAPHRRYAYEYAETKVGPVLISIKDRYERTDKIGATDTEIEVLKEFLLQYEAFWKRQPTELYIQVCETLQAHYHKMKEGDKNVPIPV